MQLNEQKNVASEELPETISGHRVNISPLSVVMAFQTVLSQELLNGCLPELFRPATCA